jgi:hypothetical protein
VPARFKLKSNNFSADSEEKHEVTISSLVLVLVAKNFPINCALCDSSIETLHYRQKHEAIPVDELSLHLSLGAPCKKQGLIVSKA